MDDDAQDMGEDGAAWAFAQLGREVSLLRAAIEGLTAARDTIESPDYEPTLARTEKILAALAQRVDAMGKSPAMTLTPETLGQRLNAAVAKASNELRGLIHTTRADMNTAVRDMHAITRSRRDRDVQDRWLYGAGLGGLIAGLLVYTLLGGPIVRATPDSWQWPERVATRVLGETSPWDAGQRLMRGASPASWNGIVASNRVVTANRDVLDACRKAAVKAKKPVRCTIEIKDGA